MSNQPNYVNGRPTWAAQPGMPSQLPMSTSTPRRPGVTVQPPTGYLQVGHPAPSAVPSVYGYGQGAIQALLAVGLVLSIVIGAAVGVLANKYLGIQKVSSSGQVPGLEESAPIGAVDGWRPRWMPPQQAWKSLPEPDPQSTAYPMQIPVFYVLRPIALENCPVPTEYNSMEHWKRDIAAQWDCVHAAWQPVLANLGLSTTKPGIRFFRGTPGEGDCPNGGPGTYYCSRGKGTLYVAERGYHADQDWDLSVNELVNHEYSHHLQRLLGVRSVVNDYGANDLSRRLELQATCWSAIMTYWNRSVEFDADDYNSWEQRLGRIVEDGIHGSKKSLKYWGMRGLSAQNFGDCNTWVVDSADVD